MKAGRADRAIKAMQPVRLAIGLVIAESLALAVGGIARFDQAGSGFDLAAAAMLLVTAAMLHFRRPGALRLYAIVLATALAWALWHAGFDREALGSRLPLLWPLGLWLMAPPVRRVLVRGGSEAAGSGFAASPGARPLGATLLVVAAVLVAVWAGDPPAADVAGGLAAGAVAPGGVVRTTLEGR